MRHILYPSVAFVLVVVFAIASLPALPSVADEVTPATAATPSALPTVLTEWEAAMATHDPDHILALYTTDAVWEEVPLGLVATGQPEIREHLEQLFAATPDITYDVTGGFATANEAVAEWTISGTLTGDFPGLPPGVGQPYTVRGLSVFQVEDGQIARYTEYWDAYGFLIQLGALPPPATPAP
jgi:steroid delta-isomerase-like uncharacterized protein